MIANIDNEHTHFVVLATVQMMKKKRVKYVLLLIAFPCLARFNSIKERSLVFAEGTPTLPTAGKPDLVLSTTYSFKSLLVQ